MLLDIIKWCDFNVTLKCNLIKKTSNYALKFEDLFQTEKLLFELFHKLQNAAF